MGLLDRLLGGRESLGTYSPNRWPLSEVPSQLFSGRSSGAGVQVDEESALSLSAVFAGVQKLSSITAALPLSVFRKDGERRVVADSLPAHRLLHTEYNPEMSAFIARRTTEFHRLLWGNSYCQINWDGAGRPAALWPIEPWRVRPKRDDDGSLYYLIDGRRRIEPGDMLHETLLSTDGVSGRSFIDYAACSLGLSISAQEFSERFFGNDARPGGMLTHDGMPKADQRAEMRESWERTHKGPENAGKTGVLWGGWKYDATGGSMTPLNAQLIEARRFSTEEVSRWLNIPPHILYDLSRSTNNNIEHQGLEFLAHSLGPTLVLKEQEYGRKLLNPPKLYAKHNVNGLLRGDSAARAEFYSKMLTNGSYTINKVLDLEDEDPIGPDGDVHFVAVNMQPIERAIRPPAPPAPIVQAPPVEEPEDDPPGPEDNAPKMQAALRELVAGTFGRLAKKEINEARRAAKKPGEFHGWLDSFYPEFERTLAEALAAPLGVLNSAGGEMPSYSAGDEAADYCKRSRESLLEVAGSAKAPDFPAAVERELAEWEATRAADEADRILGEHG